MLPDTLQSSRSKIASLEYARGKRGHAVLGMIAGVACGALIGGAVGASSDVNDKSSAIISNALEGGLSLLFLGTVVGGQIKTERWERVSSQ